MLLTQRSVRPPYALLCKVRVAFYSPSAPVKDGEDGLSRCMADGKERDAVRKSQGCRSGAAAAH